MDIILGKVTQQAMNYAIRSGVTITAGYAIRQSSRLLKAVEGNEKQELQDLQERLDSKIRIISPAIDMIELISARGNTSLESAVSLTKSLRWEIQALGQRLATAANAEELTRRGSSKAQSKIHNERELKRIIQDIRKLLTKIEDAVPLINLAITASGASLSTSLPSTVSPSRLLQASTFLTAGDSQYSMLPSSTVQIGPAFTLSLYMLFSGHLRPQSEEDMRESTWKEVIHKAHVKLVRVPLDALYSMPDTNQSFRYSGSADGDHVDSARQGSESKDYIPSHVEAEAKADEFAYQLIIIEDLEDGRFHSFDEDEAQPGPYEDVELAGIREAIPIHEISKIFYADTGKILSIGNEVGVNNPVLLLKRDVNAIPPRRLMERYSENHALDQNEGVVNGDSRKPNMDDSDESQSLIDAQLMQEHRSSSMTPAELEAVNVLPPSDPWVIPPGLDPEWLAFEVYTGSNESDTESETEQSSAPRPTPSRAPSSTPQLTSALTHLNINTPTPTSSPAPQPRSFTPQTQPTLPPIRTSLSLLETLLRLLSLQQFQQTPHLSIPDELLTFFLSESATTGASSSDTQERKRLRYEARRRVGFDPYDESPVKRRGEEYQYRAGEGGSQSGWENEYGAYDEGYDTNWSYPPQRQSFSREQTPHSPPLLLRNPSLSPRGSTPERPSVETPSVVAGSTSRHATPLKARWGGVRRGDTEAARRGSPLARGGTDEGLGTSPASGAGVGEEAK